MNIGETGDFLNKFNGWKFKFRMRVQIQSPSEDVSNAWTDIGEDFFTLKFTM